MSNTKSVSNLSGTESSIDWNFSRAKVTAELDVSNPKNIRGMQLSQSGLMLYKGRKFLVIPADEIWKMAESVEPAFIYTPPTIPAAVPNPKQNDTAPSTPE